MSLAELVAATKDSRKTRRRVTLDEAVTAIAPPSMLEPTTEEAPAETPAETFPVERETTDVPPIAAIGELVECRGQRLCPNPQFLYAVVNGERAIVKAGHKWAKRLVGKPFKARFDYTDDGVNHYIHEP